MSGQNLTAGDYPVDVAIGHPTMEDAFFHLVNLPTPRRRKLYEQWLRRPNAEKLAEITRHTTTRYLERKSPLSESELVVLPHLDAKLMSAFAAEMLLTVEDQPLPRTGALRYGGRPSHHGMLCGALAAVGTKEAVPKLLEALQAERVLPPGHESPYRLDWLAALAIATNDPWPEAGHLAGRAGVAERPLGPRPHGASPTRRHRGGAPSGTPRPKPRDVRPGDGRRSPLRRVCGFTAITTSPPTASKRSAAGGPRRPPRATPAAVRERGAGSA